MEVFTQGTTSTQWEMGENVTPSLVDGRLAPPARALQGRKSIRKNGQGEDKMNGHNTGPPGTLPEVAPAG
jgi:hypothetical protein